MAGDLNKPSGTSTKANVLTEIRDNILELIKMTGNFANLVTGAIRRNSTSKKFEEYNAGTASWGDVDLSGQTVGRATTADGPTSSPWAESTIPTLAKSKISGTGTWAESDIPTLAKSKISGTGTWALSDLPTIGLSKMGSVVVNSSVSVAQQTESLVTLGTGLGATHKFYSFSGYPSVDSISLIYGDTLSTGPGAHIYMFQRRNKTSQGYIELSIVNQLDYGGNRTVYYKAYDLSE